MKQRIVSGVIAGAVFIVLTVLGGWVFYALLLFLAIVGYAEFCRLNGIAWHHPAALLGLAGMLYQFIPWDILDAEPPAPLHMIWLLLFVLMAVTVFTKNAFSIDGAALLLLGALYVGFGFHAMYTVRDGDPHGLFATCMAFAAIWASDVGAYFCGKAFGKHKLWPAISPNKTIEGSVGGVVLSLVVTAVFSLAAPDFVDMGTALLIGLVAALAGQLGDLIQSAYKRVRGIKDSGSLLPGHGGVLDRCDSWIIVFPLLVMSGLMPL